jgi:hypothetical protein
MSQENVEIVREAWDAYSRGDYERIAGFHDPHIEEVIGHGDRVFVPCWRTTNAGTKPGRRPRQPS